MQRTKRESFESYNSLEDKVQTATELIGKMRHWLDAVEKALLSPETDMNTKTPRVFISSLNASLQPLLKSIEMDFISQYCKETRM